MSKFHFQTALAVAIAVGLTAGGFLQAQQKTKAKAKASPATAENPGDARNSTTKQPQQPRDPEFAKYAIYEQSAPRAAAIEPVATALPLELKPGDHVAFIGNTLFERSQLYGQVEALLQQRFPQH